MEPIPPQRDTECVPGSFGVRGPKFSGLDGRVLFSRSGRPESWYPRWRYFRSPMNYSSNFLRPREEKVLTHSRFARALMAAAGGAV